jgi:hypothetical protein
MPDHTIARPKLFISHASSDGDFANAIKQEVEKVFANGVDVFSTSSPGAIRVGRDWLQDIESKLQETQAVIAIVTPISIERPWLWFELGASWMKGRSGDLQIYPLCAPEIDLGNLPAPLNRLQALSMGKAGDLKQLFQALILQFGFGKISSFKAANISKRIPKYRDVKIADTDNNDRRIYSGRYTGYSDTDLMEFIDTHVFLSDDERFHQYVGLFQGREELVHNGKLLHYNDIDRNLDLPPGTAKRLLKAVAERYRLEVAYESENMVRFRSKHRR